MAPTSLPSLLPRDEDYYSYYNSEGKRLGTIIAIIVAACLLVTVGFVGVFMCYSRSKRRARESADARRLAYTGWRKVNGIWQHDGSSGRPGSTRTAGSGSVPDANAHRAHRDSVGSQTQPPPAYVRNGK